MREGPDGLWSLAQPNINLLRIASQSSLHKRAVGIFIIE